MTTNLDTAPAPAAETIKVCSCVENFHPLSIIGLFIEETRPVGVPDPRLAGPLLPPYKTMPAVANWEYVEGEGWKKIERTEEEFEQAVKLARAAEKLRPKNRKTPTATVRITGSKTIPAATVAADDLPPPTDMQDMFAVLRGDSDDARPN